MIQYKLIEDSEDVLKKDGDSICSVPADELNSDWIRYQAWLEDGNTPLAHDADWS